MSSPLSSPSRKASLKPYSPSPRSSNINSSDIDMDTAFPDNINVNSTINTTPNTSTSSTGASDQQKRAVAEVIAESFPPFDHQAAVVGPFEAEQKRDEEFKEELASKLLSLLLKTHAWSSSRPTHQSEHEAGALEKDINDVIAIEEEQGRSPYSASHIPHALRSEEEGSQHSCASLTDHQTYSLSFLLLPPPFPCYPHRSRTPIVRARERLRDFVGRIKIALAALTGLGSL